MKEVDCPMKEGEIIWRKYDIIGIVKETFQPHATQTCLHCACMDWVKDYKYQIRSSKILDNNLSIRASNELDAHFRT